MGALIDKYGRPIYSQRKFAGGAERGDRTSPTMPIYDGDFSKLVPNIDRKVLVSAARAIFQDYGPITGAVIQKADHTVGRAWNPKFMGEDLEWGEIAKNWLETQWYGNCDVRGRAWDYKTLLWLDSVALDRDGDFLILLTESESGYPLTQRICVNRIGQRDHGYQQTVRGGPFDGAKITQGVITNRLGRPIGFRILGDVPEDDRDIRADQVIHAFDPLWHDQMRGIPSYAGAIKAVYGSMTAHEREQMNQNIRSSIAFFEWNEDGGPDTDHPGTTLGTPETQDGEGNVTAYETPTVEHYAGGMIKYFRAGSGGKVESLKNDQPGNMWDSFQDRVIRMAASGMNWPYELIWKGEKINSALVRNIQEKARLSVESRQDVLRNPAIFTVRYAIAKAMKSGIIPRPRNESDWWKWSFQMPRKFSIDQGRDAAQRREDFKLGLRNRSEIHEEEGRDVEVMENERITEVIRRERKINEALEAYEEETGQSIDRRLFYMVNGTESAPIPTSDPEPEDEDVEREEDEEEDEESNMFEDEN